MKTRKEKWKLVGIQSFTRHTEWELPNKEFVVLDDCQAPTKFWKKLIGKTFDVEIDEDMLVTIDKTPYMKEKVTFT